MSHSPHFQDDNSDTEGQHNSSTVLSDNTMKGAEACSGPIGEGYKVTEGSSESSHSQKTNVRSKKASLISGAFGHGRRVPSYGQGQKHVPPAQERGRVRKLLLWWTTRPSIGPKEVDGHPSVPNTRSSSRFGNLLPNGRASSDPKGLPDFSDGKSGGVTDQHSFMNCTLSLKVRFHPK